MTAQKADGFMRENELANVSRNFPPRPSEWSVETIERVRTLGLLSSRFVPVQQWPGPIDSRGECSTVSSAKRIQGD
jgi:hypothetical protein